MANIQNRQERQLEQILLLPGNNVCADCKAPSPRWASINLSIFLCITCASIHRSLGTHTSRIKSLSLDTWTREMVDAMRKGGNIKGNEEWWPVDVRERFPVPLSTTGEQGGREGEMERFIRRKYEEGAFRADRVQRRERQEEETIRKPVPRSGRDVYGYTTGNSLPIPATGGYNDTSRSSPDNNNNNNNADFYRSSNRPQSVAGPSSFISGTGKKTSSKTARAHVDANWADFLDVAAADPPPVSTSTSTSLSSNAGRANQAARGKKAGRLLGMPFIGSDDDRGFGGDVDAVDRRVYGGAGIGGAVRLPPVTKAPKGLAYKSDSKPRRSPPPPVPSKKEHLARLAKMTVADVDRNGDGNGTTATPTPTPALIDIAQAQPPPMQNPPAGPVGNIHTTMPSAQTMMPAQQSNQMMMMMTNPYNPFIQVQPQYQQQQQQQFQQQHQFQPHFPNQPTYHHHPQQQISFGGQSMQPTMGMGIGMMSQGNGTMYSQQFQPPNTHQQQPQLYAAASQQMGGNSGGGYYNAQGQGQAQGMNAYGQSQMGQPQQQQPQQMGQGQMMGQMGQMQQGQGMMGWQ